MRTARCGVGVVVVGLMGSGAWGEAFSLTRYDVIAATGQEAPGSPGWRFFAEGSALSSPVLWSVGGSPNGAVAFVAGAEASEGYPNGGRGIWATRSSEDRTLRWVVGFGDDAPGTGGAVFDEFQFITSWQTVPVAVNRAGQVAYEAWLQSGVGDASSGREGLWISTPNETDDGYSTELVMRSGDPAPGTIGAMFARPIYQGFALNDRGDVLFLALLLPDIGDATTKNRYGLWLSSPADARTGNRSCASLVRAGDPAPGVPGAVFGSPVPGSGTYAYPSLNNSGQAAFVAPLAAADGSGALQNPTCLWTGSPGDLEIVAREGDVCPGTDGATFDLFYIPVITDGGIIAFYTTLSSVAPDESFAQTPALCEFEEGAIRTIVRAGDPVPSAPGYRFLYFPYGLTRSCVNARGDILFAATLDAESGAPADEITGQFLYHHDSDSIELIALEGQPAPTKSPSQFGNLASHTLLNLSAINDRGDIAFPSDAVSRHVSFFRRSAGSATILPVCVEQETEIDVPNGEGASTTRTVSSVWWKFSARPDDFFPVQLDETGAVAMATVFTDGTSAVVRAVPRSLDGRFSLADIDGDGVVTAGDFNILAASFGDAVDPEFGADLTGDGFVDIADFALFARDYGTRAAD